MDRKENLLATLRHEPHDHVSCLGRDMYRVGGIHDTFDNGPAGGGRDGFGTLWVATDSAFGGATPVTSAAPLDSLCDWQNRVTFPNLADHDWSGFAEADLAAFNRDERVLCYDIWNAQFLRFTHILGIENALCALKDDPEESRALLDAITTWTISYAQHAYAAYHPDVICIFDCFATQRGLFVSPDMYRSLIMPEHRRLNDAIVEMGALPCMHVCGDPREVVADFADEHTQAWEACNLALEMVETAREMGDGLALIGSCNLRVDFSTRTVSEEEVRQRTREVIEAFAPLGNFAFMGASMMLPAEESMHFKQIADEEAIALGTDYYRR